MEVVHQLARYVVAARERDLPDEARAAACRSVLDRVAAAAAGIAGPGPAAIRKTALATLAPGDHPVWFTAKRTNPTGAIWCNSAIAAALDLDDGHRLARPSRRGGHSGGLRRRARGRRLDRRSADGDRCRLSGRGLGRRGPPVLREYRHVVGLRRGRGLQAFSDIKLG